MAVPCSKEHQGKLYQKPHGHDRKTEKKSGGTPRYLLYRLDGFETYDGEHKIEIEPPHTCSAYNGGLHKDPEASHSPLLAVPRPSSC